MFGGIVIRERRLDSQMRRSMVRYSLRFPMALDSAASKLALSTISGLPPRAEVVFETSVTPEGIKHAVFIPQTVTSSVVAGLTAAIPALRVTEEPLQSSGNSRIALSVFLPTPCVLAGENPEAPLRMLAGLHLYEREAVTLRWVMRPGSPPRLPTPEPTERGAKEAERAWRQKTTVSAGFQLAGLALVKTEGSSRARALVGQVSTILRTQRGPVGALRLTTDRGGRSMGSLPRTTRASGWANAVEALPLLLWPIGEGIPGVEVGAARELLVPRHVPRAGRRLFIGRDAGGDRPVALSADGARHHMAVVGPAGVGKSVLLANCVLSDIERGYAGAVIDPKSDLLDEILNRVKPEHADRIVVLDGGDDSRPVPGIDVLHGGDPDARADVLTRTFKAMFTDWGIRSETYGRLSIRTLSEVPGATLMDMGRLFADEPYRRAAIARLRDPFLISSWQNYEALSPAAKVDVVQAPMARVMALLSRPRVRAVLANPEPKLDVARLFAERKFLLVSLAPGVLGEASVLIGSAVMYAVWSAIEARVALPPERRHLINLYVDELATLTNGLPNSFELIAERARGLGASLSVALQTLSRIPEPTRSAVLGNAATFITFRAPAEEAAGLARQLPGLTPQDVQSLGRFEVAARVGTGTGSAVSVMTGRTEPLPPATGQAGAIRDRSARLYGPSPQQRDEDPSAAHEQPGGGDAASLGRGRRQG
jgi:hypothetical protein